MSGVRNLRAMFEQKGENNPPDRGRSPGPGGLSVGSPSPSHSPRPLSKVRTTFVAVEKDGRVGLRREHSGDSISVSSRRFSNETDTTTPQPASEKADDTTENMAKNASAFKTNLSQEAIPESPVQSAPPKSSPKKESRSPNLAPNPNPDKITDEEEPKTRLLPGNPTDKAATRGSSVTPTPATSATTNGKPKTAATTKSVPKAAPVSTATKSVSKAPKSPNTLKPTATTTKSSARASSLPPQKKPTPAASKPHEAPKKAAASTTAKSTVTSGKKPASLDLPPSGAGFVKPKPKSPTRPVKLPSSLTAPTTSYASKLGTGNTAHPPRQSLSRASGNAQHLNAASTTHRSPSRASIATAGTASHTKGLKRQSSTISRPRPSLGPPPKPAAKDHPVAKKEAHVDESFLARMMRPTQASSSKTSEKAPVTPPRKQSAPATANKKPITKEAETSAKKASAKLQSSINKVKAPAESAKPAGKAAPTAKEVAPVVAQTETAEAAIATSAVEKAEQASKESKEAEESVATVPAITEDPQKVEDIEDLVQEAIEEPVGQSPAESAVEVSAAHAEEPKEAEDVQAAHNEAPGVIEVSGVEGSKVEEPAAETEETKAEAPNVEDAQVQEARSEITPEDP
ncbi:hypothetical protein K449DRAFT_437304 [Hypoxylon sp. EC38]|nr:hypothetical protein K449DRAFT_437304 [Hypoxylon sp. EC38]